MLQRNNDDQKVKGDFAKKILSIVLINTKDRRETALKIVMLGELQGSKIVIAKKVLPTGTLTLKFLDS